MTQSPSYLSRAASRFSKLATEARKPLPAPKPAVVSDLSMGTDCNSVLSQPLALLPASLWSKSTMRLPLPEGTLEQSFGDEINQFAIQNIQTRTGQSSQQQGSGNLISTATARSPFLVRSVGIVIATDFEAFALAGLSTPAPTAAGSLTPAFDGTYPFVAGSADRPATFEYGRCSWQAAWAFMSAYRFQIFLNGEFRIMDELVRQLGGVEPNFPMQGFGSSDSSLVQRIRDSNQHQRDIADCCGGLNPSIFLPITSQAIAGNPASTATPPIARTSSGGPTLPGIFGSCYALRPMVFLPGQPIDNQFVRESNDSIYYNQFVEATTDPGFIAYDANYSGVLAGGEGYAGAVTQRLGTFDVGVLYRGSNITPLCCLQWYAQYGWFMQGFYGQAKQLATMNEYANSIGLQGVPKPLAPHMEGSKIRQYLAALPDHARNQLGFTEDVLAKGNNYKDALTLKAGIINVLGRAP